MEGLLINAFINWISSAVPDHDVHALFIAFARALLVDEKTRAAFDRMTERSGIAHRYSILHPGNIAEGEVDEGFYRRGRFPGTAARMAHYERDALALALCAVEGVDLTIERDRITHLIVASCTEFAAPGLDLQLASTLRLRSDVERTLVGFMGCSAAVPALRLAHHIVRSEPAARVLVVNLELCTLHLQETSNVETLLSFLLFGDGCAAALVTADPTGIALGDFRTAAIPNSADLITWQIGEQGFRVHLSGKVPSRIAQTLRAELVRPGRDGSSRPPARSAWWAKSGHICR